MSHRHFILSGPFGWTLAFVLLTSSAAAQFNDWISPVSGDWDNVTNWSAGLPDSSQLEVRIINANSKAAAIQPGTPVHAPGSMTVQNLRVGGVPPNTNLLLLNYSGSMPSLSVLHDLNIDPNGRLEMLYAGLKVNGMINVHGPFDQESGELVFTNSSTNIMQIEGGRFNLTNGVVTGKNLYLGGTNDGFATQASGLVSLDWLVLGGKSSFPNSSNGTYTLQSGWLIVNTFEGVGGTGFGTLIQTGGTNSASDLAVGYGTYVKNGGGLFAGEVRVTAPSAPIFAPPTAILTHAGGSTTITNVLRLVGQGFRLNPRSATFNMLGGSLSTPRIQMEVAGVFTHSSGTVNVANELFITDNGTVPSTYYLSGGNVFAARTTVSTSSTGFSQSGGTHIVTNTLRINSTALYQLSGGTVNAPEIVLTGSLSRPPQFFIVGAPSFTITNESISLTGGAIVIQDSAQKFGRLTITSDSGINLAGNSAVLRFADSHTNNWQGEFAEPPHLMVYGWNGSTNGGGTDQLSFGNNSSALTASQLAQIQFINPTGFPSGTYAGRILSSGEVVPVSPPTLNSQYNGMNLVLSWSGSFILQSATNVVGPYFDVPSAPSPYGVNVRQFPIQFFRLRN